MPLNRAFQAWCVGHSHYDSEWFARWSAEIRGEQYSEPTLAGRLKNVFFPSPPLHRKWWEWCAIAEVLQQRGMLAQGRCGIGFGVGREPLSSLFARRGVSVLATDLDTSQTGGRWAKTGQQATALDDLYWPKIIAQDEFRKRVRFRQVDMCDLSDLRAEKADFIWSSCSLEHLGTLEKGFVFVQQAMEIVNPGGIAVHTTEYNVRSNKATIQSGPDVIYRRRDIEAFAGRFRAGGAELEKPDFRSGKRLADLRPDRPPFFRKGRYHVKLWLGPHVVTSILIVIQK